jgi:hypothetical protein
MAESGDSGDDWYEKALANGKGFQSEAEKKEYFSNLGDPEAHPLFADLDDLERDNPEMFEAFSQIREEDKTPIELAIMYKDEGNENLKHAVSKTRKEKERLIGLLKARENYIKSLGFIHSIEIEQQSLDDTKADDVVVDGGAGVKRIKCENGHAMSAIPAGSKPAGYHIQGCDKCGTNNLHKNGHINHHCIPCQYDLCYTCASAVAVVEAEAEESFPSVYDDKIIKKMGEEDIYFLNKLKSKVLSNKALVSLKMENYGDCRKDAELAIQFWRGNNKAWYRMCKALQCVRRYDDCRKSCLLALSANGMDFSDKGKEDIEKILQAVNDSLALSQRVENEKNAHEKALEMRWYNAWNCMTFIGAVLGYHHGSQPEQLSEEFSLPRCLLAENGEEISINDAYDMKLGQFKCAIGISLPLVFLYPQYNKIDVIQAASPRDDLSEHLDTMFPIGGHILWDKESEYINSNLVCYICTNTSPVTPTVDEWVESCKEIRDASGVKGYEISARANARIVAREKAFQKGIDANAKMIDSTATRGESGEPLIGGNIKIESENKYDYISLTRARNCIEVDRKCTIQTILTAPGHVISGGVVTILCFPRNNLAHNQFIASLKKEGSTIAVMKAEPDE